MSSRLSVRCSARRVPRDVARLTALLLALSCTFCAHASEPKEPAAAKASPADPMTHLKDRLQEKLGAMRAQEGAGGANDLKVPSRTPTPTPSTRAARGSPEALAAQRNGKPGAEGHEGRDVHWAYFGEGGPSAWAQLRQEFGLCGRGTRQSPIDIRDGIAVDLDPPKFDYRPSGFSVIDNGHTVQVNVEPGNTVEVTGRRYELVQFHFHRPSEERINGRQYEMSVHLVHRDAEGRLAVVAVVLERGAAQPVVQQVWNNLPLEKNETVAASSAIDLTALLPADLRYYTYMGSLTTPPCSEGVLWMVMQQPVPVSSAQIGIFSRLYPMNARPVQPSAGRLIKQSQ